MLSTQKTIIASQFKNKFRFPYKDFPKPIEYIDAVGIGIKKTYPNGYASGYGIIVPKQELERGSPLKKLYVHVTYGENTQEGILLRSKPKLSDPVDLSSDDFFYNIDTDKFYYKQKEIRPEEILSIINEDHIKPTKKILGFPFRCKFWFWNLFLPALVKYFDAFLIKLLWVISGEKIKEDILKRMIDFYVHKEREQLFTNKWYSPREESKPVITDKENLFKESQTMDFFGYKAKRWSVVFYSVLHLIIVYFFFQKDMDYEFVSKVLNNNFYILCYIVVSFAITESWIPNRIKSMISKATPQILNFVSHKRFKV